MIIETVATNIVAMLTAHANKNQTKIYQKSVCLRSGFWFIDFKGGHKYNPPSKNKIYFMNWIAYSVFTGV